MTRPISSAPVRGGGPRAAWWRGIAAIVALALASSAHANALRAERALSAPRAAWIDPGPAEARMIVGTFTVQIVPAHRVRAICPQGLGYHSRACTIGTTVIMPDEESSGLTTAEWLTALRHELLHAMGLDWHGPRP